MSHSNGQTNSKYTSLPETILDKAENKYAVKQVSLNLWTLVLASALLSPTLLLIGCDNEATVKAQVSRLVPQGEVVVSFKGGKGKAHGHFPWGPEHTSVQGEASISCSGSMTTSSGTTLVTPYEVKVKGPSSTDWELECDDPVLLEVPPALSKISGTFTAAGQPSGKLVVTGGQIASNPGSFYKSEPGREAFAISFPQNTSTQPVQYTVKLHFDLPRVYSPAEFSKELAAVKIIIAGHANFHDTLTGRKSEANPPIFPATDDFSKGFLRVGILAIQVKSVP